MNSLGSAAGSGTWHVDDTVLEMWVNGQANAVVAASVEQHVTRCGRCQAATAAQLPSVSFDAIWTGVLDTIEAPRSSWVTRALVRLGVSRSDALLVSAAPSLRLAWLVASLAVLLFAAVAATYAGSPKIVGLFLLIAPLAPMVGVAAAYGPESDPTHELATAAPYSKPRLVLLRAAAVLAVSLPLTVAVGLLLPIPTLVAAAWLLPALGFVAVVLAAGTWIDPLYAAAVVAFGWVSVVGWAVVQRDPHSLFSVGAIAAYVAIGALATTVFVTRIRHNINAWGIS
jgi:hypothetical protein